MEPDNTAEVDEIKERPSWLLPLMALVVTVIFGCVILWSYLGYSLDELLGNTVSGTERGRLLNVTIGEHSLAVPANYTQYPKDRRDGPRPSIELFTVLPDFVPFSRARREEFLSDKKDARVIVFNISAQDVPLKENDRVERFLRDFAMPNGTETDVGLVEYQFKPDSSYTNQRLYVFSTETGLKGMIRCLRETERMPVPFCFRETELGNDLSLFYRFRKAHLGKWQMIDKNMLELAGGFLRTVPDNTTAVSTNF